MPRRVDSFRCLNQTTLFCTTTALCPAMTVVAIPLHLNTQICTAFALLFNSMPLRCFSQLSRCRRPSFRSISFASLCDATLCRAKTVQIESMLCLCDTSPIFAYPLRRGAVPMPSSSLPCQNNAQICSSVACPCRTIPTPCHSNLCHGNTVRFIS
jgi:hypothetical protein